VILTLTLSFPFQSIQDMKQLVTKKEKKINGKKKKKKEKKE
jgi:hypothetical protein